MKTKKFILTAVILFLIVAFLYKTTFAEATSTSTTTPIRPGGIVVVQNYRGAPFTWERWLKPVLYVWVEAGKTLVCVFNPNNSEVNTCNK